MGIINKERFVELMIASPVIDPQVGGYDIFAPPQARPGLSSQVFNAVRTTRDTLRGRRIDRASALVVYDQIRDYIKQYGYLGGKQLRPWDIDEQLYERLDRKKAWWGFEFETGYVSTEARARTIEHCWNTWDNVVFDSEGEGNAAVEITFTPDHMENYLNETADAVQFIKFLDGNKDVMKTQAVSIGTHINISHPLLTADNMTDVVYSMNRTLAALPITMPGVDNVRLKMFGRAQLYGGFFQNRVRDSVWTEGKLFRTAYDLDTFRTYIKVSEGLTKCLEVLCRTPYQKSGATPVPYIDNLYEVVFDGAEPEVKWSARLGTLDGLRRENNINGVYARRNPDDPEPIFVDDYDDDDYEEDDDDDYYEDDEYEDDDGPCMCDECRAARDE